MGGLDDYLSRQQVGQVESEGVFTLDPAKAREKLRHFQLPAPDYCLLKFVQAATAWGASIVLVEGTRDSVRFDFLPDRELPPATRWPTLLDKPLEIEDPAELHLAVGLMAALQRYHHISWSYTLEGERHSVSISPEEMRCGVEPTHEFEACLFLKGRSPPELELIREHCRHSAVQVSVNGVPTWQEGPRAKTSLLLEAYLPGHGVAVAGPPSGEVKVSSRAEQVWIGQEQGVWPLKRSPRAWLYQSFGNHPKVGPRYLCGTLVEVLDWSGYDRRCALHLVVDGVTIRPVEVDLPCLARVVMNVPQVKQDLSGFQVVKDATFRRVVENLRAQIFALGDTLKLHADLLPPVRIEVRGSEFTPFGDWLLLEQIQSRGHESKYRAIPVRSLNVLEEVVVTLCRHHEHTQEFLEDNQELQRLVHPKIVPLLSSGEVNGVLYRVEAPYYGLPLSELVPAEGLELDRVREYLGQLCRLANEVHRLSHVCEARLSPESVLISGGTVRLLNVLPFRLNPRQNVMGRLTREKVRWLSPEEIQGGKDLAADVYRLGLLAYFMMTGLPPYDSQEPMSIVMSHLSQAPPNPAEARPEIPEDLGKAVQRALGKSAQDRFADAAEFGKAVEAAFS